MLFWLLCALLILPIGQTEQYGYALPIKDVKVFAEETDTSVDGAWVLNVAWRDENNQSENVSYDIEVFHTEQMRTVHFETTHMKPYETSLYLWKWTSPIPLQCTSHSVRLRRRNQQYTGEWTALFVYKGEDQNPTKTVVYPQDPVFVVGSNITFCCILKTENTSLFSSTEFTVPISNRTFITKPIPFHSPSNANANINCESVGSSVFIGYPPDDQDLTCVTQDLNSVECHWKPGRKTHLYGSKRTTYTLNGRKCEFNKCGPLPLTKQVTTWTLTAKNLLGTKTLIDIDDPTHRVLLEAPSKISYAANARNVTLWWRWNIENASFQMICQAMLNGSIYNKTFNGVGLVSIVLEDLQPNANYIAKVSCGSSEHFYKWSKWSEIAEFKTKEDIPEAVDVWIHYSEHNTYVVWKPLTQQQSHGIVTGYELTMKNTKRSRSEFIDKELNKKLCYNVSKSEQTITVSAKNSAGVSPSSTIIIQSDLGNEVNISRINSSNGGFEIFWRKHPSSTCGYVVEWFPTYSKTQCSVEWKKIPQCDGGACESWNQSGVFEAGVKYTISIYACTDDTPVLLQRSEGYAIEQRPLGTVQRLRLKQKGRNIELSWDEVPLDQQKGFIQGYKVKTILPNSSKNITNVTKEPKVHLTLDPGFYTFRVSAFTSGGEGDEAVFRMDIERDIVQMIVATVVGCSAATLVFIIITILCYRKRKWLKNLLYPDIPEPKLAGKWTTKGIYCTQMTEGYLKCEIQEVNSSESPQDLELINSKAAFLPAQNLHLNSSVYVQNYSSLWPCAKKLTSIIENPSYNMTTPDLVDVAPMSELTLEMEDSYLPAPKFVVKHYKPQSGCHTNV